MAQLLDQRLFDVLAIQDRPVGPLALALRRIVLDEAPDAIEQVFRNHPSALWIGRGPTMKDMVLYIAMASRHVNLGFCQGASLADPEQVLKGDGRVMRHIKFRSEVDLERPFVRPYIRAAMDQAVRPSPSSAAAAWTRSAPD
jgi:hypothetical protein